MEKLFINVFIAYVILNLRALYSTLIYFKSRFPYKSVQNFLTALSFALPTVAGAICISRYKRRAKDVLLIVITFIMLVVSTVFGVKYYAYEIYDEASDHFCLDKYATFTDRDNNKYKYDFDKKGFDYLFINGTDECLYTDYCYLDKDGYLIYDSDLSITVKDEYTCVDTDGKVYYPVKYTNVKKDGTIKFYFNPSNLNYDRLGKAYTYDYVPYYDKDGNKYVYSFNSDTQKGIYTKISTGDTFENEYSFVDKDGYFVYDKNHEFKRVSEEQNKTYTDKNGNVYYWASGVDWEKDGKLIVIQ